MKIDFTGKNILVTGHSRGIGKVIYDSFKKSGGNVIGVSSAEIDFVDSLKTEIYAKELCLRIKFDILVNCAGINEISFSSSNSIGQIEQINKMMNVNFYAPFIFSRAVLENMMIKEHGRIVNIGSIYSSQARTQRLGYISSKHALLGLTRSFSADFSDRNIFSNMVSPSITYTEMTAKMMDDHEFSKVNPIYPSDIAPMVLFLCSENNTSITGQNIIIDANV